MMWWMALLGCPWVGTEAWEEVTDNDGDDVEDGRFGGRDCEDGNPNVGDCDLDGDGERAVPFGPDCDDDDIAVNSSAIEICNGIDDDCDGLTDDDDAMDEAQLDEFFVDQDGDAFGTDRVLACIAPPSTALVGGDCNDFDLSIKPGATEFCDGVDTNCDGSPDAGAVDPSEWAEDLDGDGSGAGPTVESCEAPAGFAPPGDCVDDDPEISPLAIERCNFIDDDCDGLTDDEDTVPVPDIWSLDLDEDSFGAIGTEVAQCADPSSPGIPYVPGTGTDCDDALAGTSGLLPWCEDVDQDGYTKELGVAPDYPGQGCIEACVPPPGYAAPTIEDCDDDNIAINPGATEVCNGLDDNCSMVPDDGIGSLWFRDADGDGFGTTELIEDPMDDIEGNNPVLRRCLLPLGYSPVSGDCDDSDNAVAPFALERCDGDSAGRDEDCDGLIDQDDPSVFTRQYFFDGDADGHGSPTVFATECEAPNGFVEDGDDCDDANPMVYRSATILDPSDGLGDLQQVVFDTCDGGAVLFRPGTYDLPSDPMASLLIPRQILFASAEAETTDTTVLQVGPDTQFVIAPDAGLSVQELTLAGLDGITDQGSTGFVSPQLFAVGQEGLLSLPDSVVRDLQVPGRLIDASARASVDAVGLRVEDLGVGPGGFVFAGLAASVEIEESSFARVEATGCGTAPGIGVAGCGALVTAENPGLINVRGSQIEGCVTSGEAALFTLVRSNNFLSVDARIRGNQILDSGTVARVAGGGVRLERNRVVGGTGAEVFELQGTDADISGNVLIQAPPILLENSADADFLNNAVIEPTGFVFTGGSTSLACLGSTVIDVEVGENLFLGHGALIPPSASVPSFMDNRVDSLSDEPVVVGLPTCSPPGDSYTDTLAQMRFVTSTDTGADVRDTLPFPLQDFSDNDFEGAQLLPAIGATLYGPTGGPTPIEGWLEDEDDDQMADGWEIFHCGDTESNCGTPAQYQGGAYPP